VSIEKPDATPGPSENTMRKQSEQKDDGRYIIFYTFEDEEEEED